MFTGVPGRPIAPGARESRGGCKEAGEAAAVGSPWSGEVWGPLKGLYRFGLPVWPVWGFSIKTT